MQNSFFLISQRVCISLTKCSCRIFTCNIQCIFFIQHCMHQHYHTQVKSKQRLTLDNIINQLVLFFVVSLKKNLLLRIISVFSQPDCITIFASSHSHHFFFLLILILQHSVYRHRLHKSYIVFCIAQL